MKVYARLTPRDWHEAKVKYSTPQAQRIILTKCWRLENALESGELCEREEVRKETAREIAERIKNMKKNGYTYEAMIAHLYVEYGVDLEDEE